MNKEDVVFLSLPGASGALNKEIRTKEQALANLYETRRLLATDKIPPLETEIGDLQHLVASGAPQLETFDNRTGQRRPNLRTDKLTQLMDALAQHRRDLAQLGIAIEDREAELARLRSERDAAIDEPRRELRDTLRLMAREAVNVADLAEIAGKEFGRRLRELHQVERNMAEVVPRLLKDRQDRATRADRAFSLASLRGRLALAFTSAGVFEVDPDAAGLRNSNPLVTLDHADTTDPRRGMSLFDMCERHYATVIAELCRAG